MISRQVSKGFWITLLLVFIALFNVPFLINSLRPYIYNQLPFKLPINMKIGEKIDSFNGVDVYYNGSVDNTTGRNVSRDGYNIGLKYQCVEFVKRYYYEHFNHKMVDSYGHAKDFFDKDTKDGEWNSKRGLCQYTNGSKYLPKTDDLIIFGPTSYNSYGALLHESLKGGAETIADR